MKLTEEHYKLLVFMMEYENPDGYKFRGKEDLRSEAVDLLELGLLSTRNEIEDFVNNYIFLTEDGNIAASIAPL